jgi:hypothetical protein
MNDVDLVVYEVGRPYIEIGDGSSLADRFDGDAMPEAQLHALYGRVMWCVDGYNADPTELYAIPKVRKFFSEWHSRRPHWLFFSWLKSDNLKVMYLSLLSRASASSSAGCIVSARRAASSNPNWNCMWGEAATRIYTTNRSTFRASTSSATPRSFSTKALPLGHASNEWSPAALRRRGAKIE